MSVADAIKAARERKGLTDVEAADRSGLSIYEYGDVEAYDHEAAAVVNLKHLKALCRVLDIDLFELFSLEKPQSSFLSYDLNRRDAIILDRRTALTLTQDELGDKVSFNRIAIQEMESDSAFLETWCLEDIVQLAEALGVPPWVLIGR